MTRSKMNNDSGHSADRDQGPGQYSGVSQEAHHELDKRVLTLEKTEFATKNDLLSLKIWILLGIIGAVPILVTLVLLVVKFT